ncbi:MAG: OmpH family outer membrane protein [Saprospiraceae bacterium]|nr:OmpH family outer membrane protein [Saprospiraceae bacterium]
MLNRVILFICLAAGTVSLSAQKFGYVNSQEILSMMPELQEANSQLDVMKNMFSKKGQDMVQELRTKYQVLQKKQASGEVAPIVLEKEAAELKAEEEKIIEFEKPVSRKCMRKVKS